MNEQKKAFRSHYMWTLKPHYIRDASGIPIKFSHWTYICSGCGLVASSEDERHSHILEKIEDSNLKAVLSRRNWKDLTAAQETARITS